MIVLTLKAARVNRNMTLIQAAEKLEINKDSLSRLERDSTNISLSLSKKMLALYQLDAENVFFGNVDDFYKESGF